MNIFFLDVKPHLCAAYHHDRHTARMTLETAQLLSTAHHVLRSPARHDCYRPTHQNHPCALWVRARHGNYLWAFDLFRELADQYERRRGGRAHRSWLDLNKALRDPPPGIERAPATCPPYVGPRVHMTDDLDPRRHSLAAYRRYYPEKTWPNDRWTAPGVRPEWLGVTGSSSDQLVLI